MPPSGANDASGSEDTPLRDQIPKALPGQSASIVMLFDVRHLPFDVRLMHRPFLITLVVLFSLVFLNGCASTTTTTVGVTTNEAPKVHELGR
jgi:hypothetical protein